jgi:hypothetical protein
MNTPTKQYKRLMGCRAMPNPPIRPAKLSIGILLET